LEERPLSRISVIGRAGSGKTTYALRLGRVLGLPVTHLDAIYWTSDWKEVEREQFEERQRRCVAGDRWVIDGGYLSSQGWPARAARSDVIVIAEAPILVCLWRVLHRALERPSIRPDRPAGAREQVSLYFLWWTASWGWRHRGLRRRLTAAGHRVLVARTEDDLAPLMLGIRSDHG
jgi:adenylate kinase family enzyme